MRKIIVRIPCKGISTGVAKITTEAEGFVGEGCRSATEALNKALGSVESETVKPEFYEKVDDITQTVEQ